MLKLGRCFLAAQSTGLLSGSRSAALYASLRLVRYLVASDSPHPFTLNPDAGASTYDDNIAPNPFRCQISVTQIDGCHEEN